jgi:uncharacterized membrane protein
VTFELKDFLQAIGPNASLIFAAWIFLSFLQGRYNSAYDRYRAMIGEYRSGPQGEKYRQSRLEQIILYRVRCEQMRKATNLGILSALFLIASLLAAGLSVIVGETTVLKYTGACAAILGLLTVAAAATYVLRENTSIARAMQEEASDVPELAERLGVQRS